jgi:hypothetical protein
MALYWGSAPHEPMLPTATHTAGARYRSRRQAAVLVLAGLIAALREKQQCA